jgi:hypothetical protein
VSSQPSIIVGASHLAQTDTLAFLVSGAASEFLAVSCEIFIVLFGGQDPPSCCEYHHSHNAASADTLKIWDTEFVKPLVDDPPKRWLPTTLISTPY